MSSRIAEYVDPWRLAGAGREISGTVLLADLVRVTELLESDQGEVSFQLSFFSGEKKRPRIKGFVKAELILSCQRCLQPVVQLVDSELDLAVIEVPEEADLLPQTCDPIWVEDGRIKPLDLIEEELILAIPQVPRHPQGECPVEVDMSDAAPPSSEADGEHAEDATNEHNPFAVLAGLKKDE